MFFDREEDIVRFGTGTVLLLEDDEMIRQTTTEMLQHLGYTVETVTTGEKAVELYRLRKKEGNPFRVVIIDICQPEGIGGEETVRRLLEYDPCGKAVASSGLTDDKTMTHPKSYGFRTSLPKPYGIRQLGSVVRDAVVSEEAERLKDRRKDVRRGIVANCHLISVVDRYTPTRVSQLIFPIMVSGF